MPVRALRKRYRTLPRFILGDSTNAHVGIVRSYVAREGNLRSLNRQRRIPTTSFICTFRSLLFFRHKSIFIRSFRWGQVINFAINGTPENCNSRKSYVNSNVNRWMSYQREKNYLSKSSILNLLSIDWYIREGIWLTNLFRVIYGNVE